ncbi:MAG: peptidylprolyl isomerase [Oscillospiraceae bacterium]|nr:peptidylprolyl isomerase [Oscillospiraceae bacterium]
MMKKMIALLLAVILCLTMFAGCSKNEEAQASEPAVIDYEAAFTKYDPETVVMTIDGKEVTWSEFYYMLYSSMSQIQYYMGDIYWDQECVPGSNLTYEEYTMDMTITMIKQLHAVEKKSKELNLTLSDTDRAMIDETITMLKMENCGENATDEDFRTFLLENVYLTEEAYRYINENSMMYEKVFLETVGAEGEKITEDEIQAYIESVPYVTAKHILLMTVNPDTGEALTEEEIATAKTTAEQLLSQLQAIEDRDELVKTFNSLMLEYNEDPGMEVFPDGYTFTTGEMYPVFEETAFALEEYEISGIIESEAGYHILMRLPTTGSSIVDLDYTTYSYYSVLAYAATDIYSQRLTEWMEACDLQWEEQFKDITAQEIFS